MDRTLKKLLEAVREDPHNNAPRLAVAGYLEERGDPRWQFIRGQCEPFSEHGVRYFYDFEGRRLPRLHRAEWLGQLAVQRYLDRTVDRP